LRQNSNVLAKPPGIGATLIIGSLSINLLSLALPLVLLQIFDRIIPNAATQTLSVLFFGLLIALGVELILKICRIVLLAHDSARYEVDLTVSACAKILDTEVFAFSRDSAGTHSDRLAAIGQLRDHYCGQGRLLAIDMPFTVLFIGLIWYIAEWLVVVPFICLGIILVISMVIRKLQAPLIAGRQSIDRRRNSFMMEVLARITTVKALAAEDQMLRRFELLQDQSAEATRGLIWVASLSQNMGAVLGQAAVVMMAGLGAYLNITGRIGMAELAACMLLNGRTIQPMLKLLGIWAQQESLRAAQMKLDELAALPTYVASQKSADDFEPKIRFHAVTLHPQGREKPVFSDLGFAVGTGQIASLIGPDGGGKSSIMRMILGEQSPSSGEIFIGSNTPADMRLKRSLMGARAKMQRVTCRRKSDLKRIFCACRLGMKPKSGPVRALYYRLEPSKRFVWRDVWVCGPASCCSTMPPRPLTVNPLARWLMLCARSKARQLFSLPLPSCWKRPISIWRSISLPQNPRSGKAHRCARGWQMPRLIANPFAFAPDWSARNEHNP